jgi:hypothetical protein
MVGTLLYYLQRKKFSLNKIIKDIIYYITKITSGNPVATLTKITSGNPVATLTKINEVNPVATLTKINLEVGLNNFHILYKLFPYNLH